MGIELVRYRKSVGVLLAVYTRNAFADLNVCTQCSLDDTLVLIFDLSLCLTNSRGWQGYVVGERRAGRLSWWFDGGLMSAHNGQAISQLH